MPKQTHYIHYPRYIIDTPKLIDRYVKNDMEIQRWRGIVNTRKPVASANINNLPIIIEHKISLNDNLKFETLYYLESEPSNLFDNFIKLTNYYEKETR